jgi:anti-anti-sigma factor
MDAFAVGGNDMHFTIVPDTNEGILALSGELSLLQAEQLKMQLTQALEACGHVRIDVKAVTDIDLASLQLLCAAHRSAGSQGKQLALMPQPSEAFRARVVQAGLTHRDGCGQSPCLWSGGER